MLEDRSKVRTRATITPLLVPVSWKPAGNTETMLAYRCKVLGSDQGIWAGGQRLTAPARTTRVYTHIVTHLLCTRSNGRKQFQGKGSYTQDSDGS